MKREQYLKIKKGDILKKIEKGEEGEIRIKIIEVISKPTPIRKIAKGKIIKFSGKFPPWVGMSLGKIQQLWDGQQLEIMSKNTKLKNLRTKSPNGIKIKTKIKRTK